MEDSREKKDVIQVRLSMRPGHAARLVRVLRTAAVKETDPAVTAVFREIAWNIVEKFDGELHVHRRPVKRPKDDDEVALARVVRGEGPYPVLSRADARRAFEALTDKLSSVEIGNRLHVDRGTITRWRREYRRGLWKEMS